MQAAAAGHAGAADGRTAGAAGLAGPLVDAHPVLEAAWYAVDIVVGLIPGGGAAAVNALGEHLPNGVPEALPHGAGEAGGAAAGAEAGAEADLVGIDLADAGDDVLVHEHMLELGGPAGKSVREVVAGEVVGEGLGAVAREVGHLVYVVAGAGDECAEGALIEEAEVLSTAQFEERGGGSVERCAGREDADEAAHTEAEDQGCGMSAVEEEVGGLAASPHSGDAPAFDEAGEVPRGGMESPGAAVADL